MVHWCLTLYAGVVSTVDHESVAIGNWNGPLLVVRNIEVGWCVLIGGDGWGAFDSMTLFRDVESTVATGSQSRMAMALDMR